MQERRPPEAGGEPVPPQGDVLQAGSEREPWRLRRGPGAQPWRLRRGPAAAAAVLLLALAGGAAAWHTAAARARDRAALGAIRLAVTTPDGLRGEDPGQVDLGIRNDGHTPVRLLSARVDYPGYEPFTVRSLLPPYRTASISVSSTPSCLPQLARSGPERLVLDVATPGGARRRLTLPLRDGDSRTAVTGSAQRVCGLLPPGESLELAGRVGRAGPGEVVLDLDLANVSVLPLELVAVDAGAGLSARVAQPLPVAVPAQPRAGGGQRLGLSVRLRVTDCRALLERADDVLARPVGVLTLTVRRETEQADPAFGLYYGPAFAALLNQCRTQRLGQ